MSAKPRNEASSSTARVESSMSTGTSTSDNGGALPSPDVIAM